MSLDKFDEARKKQHETRQERDSLVKWTAEASSSVVIIADMEINFHASI